MSEKISGFAIKRCPFCGNTASLFRLGNVGSTHGWVECDGLNCGADMPFQTTFERAVMLWNQRAPIESSEGL